MTETATLVLLVSPRSDGLPVYFLCVCYRSHTEICLIVPTLATRRYYRQRRTPSAWNIREDRESRWVFSQSWRTRRAPHQDSGSGIRILSERGVVSTLSLGWNESYAAANVWRFGVALILGVVRRRRLGTGMSFVEPSQATNPK